MPVKTVQYTLRALCHIERGEITEAQLKGLSSTQSRLVVDETARALVQAEKIRKEAAKEALSAKTPAAEKKIKNTAKKKSAAVVKRTTKAVADTLQKGGTSNDAKNAAVNARASVNPVDAELPEINEAAARVVTSITRLLDPDYDPGKKLSELIKHRKHLSGTRINDLDRALATVIEYAEGYRNQLNK